MRIVILNQYYAPAEAATAQLLQDLAEYLAGAGHEVSMVCSGRSYPDPLRLGPSRERSGGVSIHRTWTTGFGRGRWLGRATDYATFLFGATAIALFRRRPDLIVSLTTPPMLPLIGLALARLKRARALYWVMDVYPQLAFRLGVLRPGSPAGWLLERISRYVLTRSDVTLALGETMASLLRVEAGDKVHVVHNWADGEAIRPLEAEGHPLRRAWGCEGRFVVLYSGNMGLAHDFGTVLEAADLLRDRERFLFVFAGTGPRRVDVEREAARRGLPNVQFRPFAPRSELGRTLTVGDLHLITLRDGLEGLLVPSKVYGALAAGRPCLYVGPGTGEVPRMLEQGRCGRRIAIGDASGLADAIVSYERDETLRSAHGRQAREVFERHYDMPHAMRRLREIFEATLDDSIGRRGES